MIRNSIHTFDDENSTGIDTVPVEAIIQIENYNGSPRFVQKIASGSWANIQAFMNDFNAWQEVDPDSLGAAYNPTSVQYKAGDIVTYNDGSGTKIYIANTTTSGTWDPTAWDVYPIERNEQGGVAWDSTKTYNNGDIVSRNNSIYLAQQPNINVDPVTDDGTNWDFVIDGGTY